MTVDIICADAIEGLARFPDGHFHCCVTSPPFYGLRDYGLEPTVWPATHPDSVAQGCEHEWVSESYQRRSNDGGDPERKQETNVGAVGRDEPVRHAFCRRCNAWRGMLGLEPTPELYVEHLVSVMREVRRVLRGDGTLWLNLGDSYFGTGKGPTPPTGFHGANATPYPTQGVYVHPSLKSKDLVGVPWRVAFALQADGWWLRQENIWYKKNPMPESCDDRTTRAHESVFQLTKRERYYYDADAIRETPISTGLPTAESLRGEGWHDHSRDLEEGQRFDGGSTHHKAVPATGRNRRSVWEIATQPFGLEMCGSCRTIYSPAQYRRLRGGSNPRCDHEVVEGEPCGGINWLPHDGGAMCVACEMFYTAKQLERLPRAARCRGCGSEEWLSHFAVFPEKLVEPCILTTSEWGCCPDCGAPWERVVEMGEPRQHPDVWSSASPHQFDTKTNTYVTSPTLKSVRDITTVGWRPTCKHGAEPVPCRILDPFAGSGTVGVVAERLGRHSVLIDAKPEYVEMARHRTAQMGLMADG